MFPRTIQHLVFEVQVLQVQTFPKALAQLTLLELLLFQSRVGFLLFWMWVLMQSSSAARELRGRRSAEVPVCAMSL